MDENTDETTIANLRETVRLLIAERDELRVKLAAYRERLGIVFHAYQEWVDKYGRIEDAFATTGATTLAPRWTSAH